MTHYTYNTHTIHTVSQWIHSLTHSQRARNTNHGFPNILSHTIGKRSVHTPQTKRYTHYTPFKRPWIVESKVFFIYRHYPLSSTCYTLYMNPLHMQDNLFCNTYSCYNTKRPPTQGGLLYKFYRFDSYMFYFLSEVQLKDVICKF